MLGIQICLAKYSVFIFDTRACVLLCDVSVIRLQHFSSSLILSNDIKDRDCLSKLDENSATIANVCVLRVFVCVCQKRLLGRPIRGRDHCNGWN
jgi:hypothetical protein